MNTDEIDKWLDANATFMMGDRPDIYNFRTARRDLEDSFETVRAVEGSTFISFSSYILSKFSDDGMDDYILSLKLSSLSTFDPEDETYALSHHADIPLPGLDADTLT